MLFEACGCGVLVRLCCFLLGLDGCWLIVVSCCRLMVGFVCYCLLLGFPLTLFGVGIVYCCAYGIFCWVCYFGFVLWLANFAFRCYCVAIWVAGSDGWWIWWGGLV